MSRTLGTLAEAYNAAMMPKGEIKNAPPGHESKAHHAKDRRGFINPWPSWKDQRVMDIMKGLISHRYQAGTLKSLGPSTENNIPIIKPTFPSTRSPNDSEFRATWLGHACYYVEFPGGFRALFDPVFSQRCSPVQFMGPKRYTQPPCKISEIPVVDVVCISHNHYDHMDYNTITELHRLHPNMQFFVPLGNKAWFTSVGIENCTELDWWEDVEITLTPEAASRSSGGSEGAIEESAASHGTQKADIKAKIGLLPCQHISSRTLHDLAATLWGSWSVESGGKKLYFAGDTGYRAVPRASDGLDDYGPEFKDLPHCPAFKEVGEHRGPFDLGLIPIGAYSPRWIMSPMHCNPMDAVNVFIDTKCKRALGMHWGTWILTEEEVEEPPRKLKEALETKQIAKEGVFDVCGIGESRCF